MKLELFRYVAFLLAMHACGLARSQPTIADLGTLPGGESGAGASGVNADGTVVVGSSNSASGTRAFRWSLSEGMQSLGVLPNGIDSAASGVSADGLVVVGRASYGPFSYSPQRAFYWTEANGMLDLGTLPNYPSAQGASSASSVSGDGVTVTGRSDSVDGNMAFRWRSSTGMQELVGYPLSMEVWPSGLNQNGTVAVGFYNTAQGVRAFRLGPSLQNLGTLLGGTYSSASAISADGNIVVGMADSSGGTRAFRWSATEGMQSLGVLPGTSESNAVSVSGDGRVVVGWSGGSKFLWTPSLGMVDLESYLASIGTNFDGWSLLSLSAISQNASTIVGAGVHHGVQRPYRITGLHFREVGGRILFRGLDLYAEPISMATMEFREPGTTHILYSVVSNLDSLGRFRVNLPTIPGSIDIAVKPSHWLRRKVTIDTTNGDVSGLVLALSNGDVDMDNEVAIGDYSLLSTAWNSEPGNANWFENSDLNHDLIVDIADFAVLSQNFGRLGDD